MSYYFLRNIMLENYKRMILIKYMIFVVKITYIINITPYVTRKSIESDMMALPNNIDFKDKYYVGYFKNEKLIAVLDLIDGYPKKDIVFIGFLMIDISIQKSGIGSAIVNELIDYLTTLKYKEVRLGWINGNLQAEHFWIKNGFCSIKEGRVVLANRLLNKFFTD